MKTEEKLTHTFAFVKGSLGLDLVNTRTAESLAVKIDEAIVLSNVLALMRLFGIPIFIMTEFEGVTYQISYKCTTKIANMVA